MKINWFITIYIIIFTVAVLGLILLLPRSRRTGHTRAGCFFAGTALVILLSALLYFYRSSLSGELFWFCLFTVAAIVSAVLMLCQKRVLYSALYFVLTNLSVAGLLLLQQARFLAIALVIVYAGAIVVIYVFVLMLSQQQRPPQYDQNARAPILAVLVGFFLLGNIMQVALLSPGDNVSTDSSPFENLISQRISLEKAVEARSKIAPTGTAKALGEELFEKHVAAFEIAGVILLLAAVGAIAILKAPRIKEQKQRA